MGLGRSVEPGPTEMGEVRAQNHEAGSSQVAGSPAQNRETTLPDIYSQSGWLNRMGHSLWEFWLFAIIRSRCDPYLPGLRDSSQVSTSQHARKVCRRDCSHMFN